MNYYVYLNCNGLTSEENFEIGKYAKTLRRKDFEELGGNTIYITFKDDKPFVYKVTYTKEKESDDSFDPWNYKVDEAHKNISIYNIKFIAENIEEN